MSDIVYSAMRTPDGSILRSRSRHDFVFHYDENGKMYYLDGGISYVRASCNGDEDFITITLDHSHEIVRDLVDWGTYGISGDQPLKFIKLKEMDDEHLESVIENCNGAYPQIIEAMRNELKYRGK